MRMRDLHGDGLLLGDSGESGRGKRERTELLQLGGPAAPSISLAEDLSFRSGCKPERQAQLTDCVIVLQFLLNELPCDVEFKLRAGAPIVGTPLKEKHVTVRLIAALWADRLIEREHLCETHARHAGGQHDTVGRGERFEGGD